MKVAFVSQGILLLLLCAQLAITTPIEDDLDLPEDEDLELKEERLFEDIPLAPFKDTVLEEKAVEGVEEAPKVNDAEEVKKAVKEAVKEPTDVKEAALDIPAVVELPQAVPEPVPTNVLGAEVPAEAPAETPIEPAAGLKLAQQCDSSVCKLPNCRCSDAVLPSEEFEGHEKEIPQFITVTFDDAVNAINYKQYEEMFADLVNPDHCTARGTFFVSHEYTDYSKLNALYNEGHEIALHSITHGQGTDYWLEGDVELFKREFGQQLELIEQFAKIDHKHVHGLRLPFLQLAGNNSFIAAQELGLQYDSSWPTQQFKDPPMWPYTLDYKSTQDCMIKPCPTASIPGFWVQPMVTWTDLKGYSCAMIDACVYPPENTVEEIYNWILKNFMRHYESNRAPFGMYLHAAWFARGSHNFEAMRKFLEYANTLPDVYITTPARVLQYVKHPVLGKPFKGCVKKPKTECRPVSCNLPKGDDGEMRYMTVCDRCPSAYPWLDNPLGKRIKRRK